MAFVPDGDGLPILNFWKFQHPGLFVAVVENVGLVTSISDHCCWVKWKVLVEEFHVVPFADSFEETNLHCPKISIRKECCCCCPCWSCHGENEAIPCVQAIK